jgi:hypothetical protein
MGGIDVRALRGYGLIAGVTLGAVALVGVVALSFGAWTSPLSTMASSARAKAELTGAIGEQAMSLDAAYIDALQLAYQRDPEEISAIAGRIAQKKQQFERAHSAACESVEGVELRGELCADAYSAGVEFFKVIELRVLPAAVLGQREKAMELTQIDLAKHWREHKRMMTLAGARAATSADVAHQQIVERSNNATLALGMVTVVAGVACAGCAVWAAARMVRRAGVRSVAGYGAEMMDEPIDATTAAPADVHEHERAISAMAELARRSMIPGPSGQAPREPGKSAAKAARAASAKR